MADENGSTAGERNEEVRGWPAVKVPEDQNERKFNLYSTFAL